MGWSSSSWQNHPHWQSFGSPSSLLAVESLSSKPAFLMHTSQQLKCWTEGQPGQQKQIWCVPCTRPCAHAIKNSFAHNVYEKDTHPFPTTHMQKQKKNPNTSLYAVCCFIDLLKKKEKVYSYKSLKKYDEYSFPQLPSKENPVYSHWKWPLLLQKCFKRIAWNICIIPATCQSQLYSFRSLWGCLLHVVITK